MTDNHVAETGITHLQGLLEILEQDSRLPSTRRRDYCSAIRKVGELTGQPLDGLPARLDLLRPHLEGVHPAMVGLSVKRWQNIRSDLKRVIEYARSQGLLCAADREPLWPAWQALYDTLQELQLRSGLSGFLRFCSHRGIEPTAVTDAVTQDYFEHVVANTLRKKPKQTYRNTCRLWNQAVERYEVFPDIRLTVPSFKPVSKTLPWSAFPHTLATEVDTHIDWLSGKDVLADHQPTRAAKRSTCNLRRTHLQLFASAAVRGGFAIEALVSLSILVSRPVVEKAVQRYLDDYDGKKTQYIHDIVNAIRQVAKNWVVTDEAHLAWLRGLVGRLNPNRSGLTKKNRDTLRQFDDEDNLQRLFELPGCLIDQASKQKDPFKAAVRYQLALVIRLLTVAPMRIGNLAALRPDTHVVRPGGPKGPIEIVLGDHETKNAEAHTYPLKGDTRQMYETYLRVHRPQLVRGEDHGWLWPGAGDGHKSASTLRQQLREMIAKATGLRMTPHQFRHLAARLMLEAKPGSYELARRVLGHKNLKTTVKFYAGLDSRQAVETYDSIIDERRDGKPVK
ncbi:MAG: site-specific integrase [Chromatiaceae bacterium]|nr:site-specific integrase [Chromatiaceae bacterium]